MSKITINKQVYWDAGGKKMSGKVKQIMADHALVAADGSNYLVRKAVLSVRPLNKTASLICLAAMADDPGAPKGFILSFDNKTNKWNWKWIDAVGVQGCSPERHKIIAAVDAAWKRGAIDSETTLNPELFQNKGKTGTEAVPEVAEEQEAPAPQIQNPYDAPKANKPLTS